MSGRRTYIRLGRKQTLDEVLQTYPLFRWFDPQDLVGTQTDNTFLSGETDRLGFVYNSPSPSAQVVWRETAGLNGTACYHFGIDTSGASAYTHFVNNVGSAVIDGDFTVFVLCKVDSDYLTSGDAQVILGGQDLLGGKPSGITMGSNNLNTIISATNVNPVATKKHSSPISSATSEWVVVGITNEAIYKNGIEISYALNQYLPHICLDTFGSSVTFYANEKFKGPCGYMVAMSQKLTPSEMLYISNLILSRTPLP